jgi:hypothetical protein
MPIDTRHPEYETQVSRWMRCRDVLAGEFRVKSPDRLTTYLPVPPGMKGEIKVTDGSSRYTFYASFAELPEITLPMSEGIQGLIHDKAPLVTLPADMEYLVERATIDGDSLIELWQQVTREIFYTGRIGLLAELRGGATRDGDLIHLVPYVAESLINWRLHEKSMGGAPRLAVMEEMYWEEDGDDTYSYEERRRWREFSLDEQGFYRVRLWEEQLVDAQSGKMEPEVVLYPSSDEEGWVYPTRTGKKFKEIPLTVLNATDRGFQFGPVPVWPLAKRALSIFRLSADYRRSLYVKSDPTAYVFGARENEVPTEVGGDTIWAFESPEGRVGYLDIEGDGIPLQANEIALEYERFWAEAGHMLETQAKGVEAAAALEIRQNMRQVSVKTLVKNAADGVQAALRTIARMMGKSETEVDAILFVPNLEFAERAMDGRALLEMMQAKNQGAPISLKTIHDHMNRRKLTDLSYDDEVEAIEDEGGGLGLLGRDVLPARPETGQADSGQLFKPDRSVDET